MAGHNSIQIQWHVFHSIYFYLVVPLGNSSSSFNKIPQWHDQNIHKTIRSGSQSVSQSRYATIPAIVFDMEGCGSVALVACWKTNYTNDIRMTSQSGGFNNDNNIQQQKNFIRNHEALTATLISHQWKRQYNRCRNLMLSNYRCTTLFGGKRKLRLFTYFLVDAKTLSLKVKRGLVRK